MADDRKNIQRRRPRASERRAAQRGGRPANPFVITSARERRAQRAALEGDTARAAEAKTDAIDPALVAQLLANPTKEVSEEQLRQEYSYVQADLRNMGLLAAGLVVLLVVLAQVLPK